MKNIETKPTHFVLSFSDRELGINVILHTQAPRLEAYVCSSNQFQLF